MISDADRTDFSIQFIICNGRIVLDMYVSQNNRPTAEQAAQLLTGLSNASLVSAVVDIIQQYAEQIPEQKEYLGDVLYLWQQKIREEARKLGVGPDDHDLSNTLVVQPTEFLKYPGYAGD